jgi:transcriptional antiterminator RfaH
MPQRWFVAQTHPTQEKIAELNLVAQGFPVFLPLISRRAWVRGTAIEQATGLFGPYLFISFDLEADRWRPVNHTRGVVRLLPRHREEPLPMPEGVTERWMERAAAGEFRAPDAVSLMVGDLVFISGGVYRDHHGTFDGLARGGGLRLLMSLLGRQIPVRVRPSEVAWRR